jgi:uncharacterized protein YndB with AHSA1/START domain
MPTLTASTTISRPAPDVWAIVADYERDPEWRQGVETMAPSPSGLVIVGTTTAEVLHFGGRTYRNAGEVTEVDPGTAFRWRTTSGTDAEGRRRVQPSSDGSASVTLELTVRPHGIERVLQPLLVRMLRRHLVQDLQRLAALVEREAVSPHRSPRG